MSEGTPLYAVLVANSDPMDVQVIPGARDDVLIALTLSKFDNLRNALDVVGDRAYLKLNFSRAKARDLAAKIALLDAPEGT
jgi:hypothetical protein